MNTLNVKRIRSVPNVEDVAMCFDRAKIACQDVAVVNWAEYPYKPDVKFRIAHDGDNIYMNWEVDEIEIKAVSEKDQGEVWKDSCVEFFVTFDGTTYYNIETNCIGTVLSATGADRNNRVSVPQNLLEGIKRWSSVGNKAIDSASGKWSMSLIIPKTVFYLDSIETLSGLTPRANFYKCGDDLKQPHFLSWNPIGNKTPDFHLPNFFGMIKFE